MFNKPKADTSDAANRAADLQIPDLPDLRNPASSGARPAPIAARHSGATAVAARLGTFAMRSP